MPSSADESSNKEESELSQEEDVQEETNVERLLPQVIFARLLAKLVRDFYLASAEALQENKEQPDKHPVKFLLPQRPFKSMEVSFP